MTDSITAGRREIEALVPHRDPFLFVDEILKQSERSITTRWTIPTDADWFRGHYPGQPVMPGVLICEHVFQSGALFVSNALGGLEQADGVPVLTKIEFARFRKILGPGSEVETKVQLDEQVGPGWFLSGRVMNEDKVALKIRFVLSQTGAMKRSFQEERD